MQAIPVTFLPCVVPHSHGSTDTPQPHLPLHLTPNTHTPPLLAPHTIPSPSLLHDGGALCKERLECLSTVRLASLTPPSHSPAPPSLLSHPHLPRPFLAFLALALVHAAMPCHTMATLRPANVHALPGRYIPCSSSSHAPPSCFVPLRVAARKSIEKLFSARLAVLHQTCVRQPTRFHSVPLSLYLSLNSHSQRSSDTVNTCLPVPFSACISRCGNTARPGGGWGKKRRKEEAARAHAHVCSFVHNPGCIFHTFCLALLYSFCATRYSYLSHLVGLLSLSGALRLLLWYSSLNPHASSHHFITHHHFIDIHHLHTHTHTHTPNIPSGLGVCTVQPADVPVASPPILPHGFGSALARALPLTSPSPSISRAPPIHTHTHTHAHTPPSLPSSPNSSFFVCAAPSHRSPRYQGTVPLYRPPSLPPCVTLHCAFSTPNKKRQRCRIKLHRVGDPLSPICLLLVWLWLWFLTYSYWVVVRVGSGSWISPLLSTLSVWVYLE
ncbi:hypothetical protein LZ30DRAFT_253918 [Colletotrichum cereale]|nr:hypothetical protein LZ30DRAFT_253918 [Colletotrichum cereale]